ncbi:hypothetical protein EV182_001188 [Spiromyces aspiralis]|uniref:Uncharacterized protein n=1 Tax=Spiromyces aspiralis TaxID=68401 RepID=A0ACC1HNH2_9FUNG|nr:hypothetical protein EV182_001188 [Spiromyces aspiralis]
MQFRTKIANTLRRSFRGSSGARAGAAAAPAKATRRPAVVSPTNSHIEGVSRPTDDDATLLRHSPPTTTVTTTMTHTHHSSKFRARLLTAAGKSPTVSVPPLSSSHNYQSAKPSTAGCAIQYSGIKSPTALPKLSKFKSDLSLKSALATAAKQLDVVPGSTDAVTLRWEGSKDRILRKVESVAGLSMIPLLGEGTTYDSQSGGSFRTQMHRRALTSTAVPEDNRTNSLQLDIDPTIIDETMYANDDNNDNGGGSNPARQGHQEKEEEWLMLRPVETPDMVPRLFSPQDLDRAMTPLIKTIYTNGAAGAAPSISAVLAPNFQSPTTKPRQIAPVDLENYEFSSDNLPATIASESNDRMPSDSPSQSPGKLTGSVPLAPPSSHIGHWNDSGNTASVESMVLSNPSATLHNGLDGTANQLAQPPEKTNSAGMPKKCRPSLFQLGFDEGNELSTNPSSDVLRQQETPQEVQSGVNSRQSSPALSALIMDYEDDEMFENPLAASQPILHRESVAATDGSERILEGDNEGGGWQRYRDGAKLSYHESFYALPKGGPEDSEDDFLPKSIGGVSGHASYLSPPSSPDERAGSGISSMLKLRRSRWNLEIPSHGADHRLQWE